MVSIGLHSSISLLINYSSKFCLIYIQKYLWFYPLRTHFFIVFLIGLEPLSINRLIRLVKRFQLQFYFCDAFHLLICKSIWDTIIMLITIDIYHLSLEEFWTVICRLQMNILKILFCILSDNYLFLFSRMLSSSFLSCAYRRVLSVLTGNSKREEVNIKRMLNCVFIQLW